MRVVLITCDNPASLQIRLDNRDAHLAYIAETGVVEMAGPFLDLNGQMCGSMIIMNVDSIAAAQAWADNDPYQKAGLFKDVRIEEWKKVIG
ncbi:protein YciI [Octadecabacter antarcticus 307]|uniref:Protein YciI n=1 Tax=Octadecabacter antarcticus 307 TaxID=391626 RepID=M9RD55_9RHOB|nr:YciI family protein [Octadecabacter antarcticus]AGI70112.1 protein YciI [Octadecabacter antarcticus 307]